MPRKCKICNHEKAKAINSQLVAGVSYRNISQQYGMDVASVSRHVNNCLELDGQTLQRQIKTANAIDHHAQLTKLFNDTLKYQKAAHKWLQDPDDPNEFTIEPRADEIDVIYTAPNGKGDPVKMRRSLKDIIFDIEEKRPTWTVESVFVKSADIRDYALKVMDRADMFLDRFAKTQGLYQEKQLNKIDQEYEKAVNLAEMYERMTGTPIRVSLLDLASRPELPPELAQRIRQHPALISDALN